MHRRCSQRSHFVKDNRDAGLRNLPGRLRAGETTAYDMHVMKMAGCHLMILKPGDANLQWL
jgi:hypothetical protein